MDKINFYEELEKLLVDKAKAAHIKKSDLEKYYKPESEFQNQSFYQRLASSLQNGTSSGMDKSIKFNGENFEKIRDVLCQFNYRDVLSEYTDENELYNAFKEKIGDSGADSKEERVKKATSKEKKEKIRNRKTNWQKYAYGLYKGAKFLKNNPAIINHLCQYNTQELDFKDVQEKINFITKEVPGLGTALCCDWLKECGCTWLVKPDVHIKIVYQALRKKETGEDLEYSKIKEIDVIEYYYKWVKELRENGKNITAYQLDKMIWLICTGVFYLDMDRSIGRNTLISKIENS